MMLHISISPKVRILERQDVVVEGPEGAVGAVLHALIEGVNDSVLEVRFPGKGSDSGLTLRVGKLVVAAAGHIHAGPGLHQRDLPTHNEGLCRPLHRRGRCLGWSQADAWLAEGLPQIVVDADKPFRQRSSARR